MLSEEEAFDMIKKKLPKEHHHLIKFDHIRKVVDLFMKGIEVFDIKYHKGDPGWLDHPDWEDWRQPEIPEHIEIIGKK